MRRRLLICIVLAAGAAARPVQAAPLTIRAAVEAGPEIDTNVYRIGQELGKEEAATLAPLLRLSAKVGVRRRLGRHLLSLGGGGGAKVFLTGEARSADELVGYASGGWGVRSSSRTALLFSGSYYDASQRHSTRDFRTGTAGLQLAVGQLPAGLQAAFDLGYRGLDYKPLDAYSFHGLLGGVALSWRATSGPEVAPADWELRLDYTAGLRFFAGSIVALPERCADAELQFPCTEEGSRRDFHNRVRAEAAYQGSATAALAYSLEINRSNSYGESYLRHALGLRFTAGLLYGLFLTVKATLQLSRFQDPYLVSQVSELSLASIDDENRSSLIVQFSKELSERWSINLRWSLYVNESSIGATEAQVETPAAEGFRRQTLFLGARFELGR